MGQNGKIPNWSEDWSVGIDVIDGEHSRILGLLDEISEIRSNRRDADQLSGIVASVSAYTAYHFRTEEAVLDAVDYPAREDHKKLHENLKKKTNQYLFQILNDPQAINLDKFHDFLKRWWENHILREDMAYRPYVEHNQDAQETAARVSSRI